MNNVFTLLSEDNRILLDLNMYIHGETKLGEYHMNHIYFLREYAIEILKRLEVEFDPCKIETIALSHDLFKERSLDKEKGYIKWQGLTIPHDTNRYVRLGLDVLEPYSLDEYFNTDVQIHPLSAMLFLIKEFNVHYEEILYPVVFHSCPIISIYETLNPTIQTIIDVIILSDKLSSNYLKINERCVKVRTDLDQIVFGKSGREFNYVLGLFIARLISQGDSKEKQSLLATNHYYKRLCESNPFISKKCSISKLGGMKLWPKRSSPLWKTL